MHMRERIAAAAAAVLLTGLLPLLPRAAAYDSYSYVENGSGIQDVLAPAAYLPSARLTAEQLGVELSEPVDLFRDGDGGFYLTDARRNRVYCFDRDWQLRFTVGDAETEAEGALQSPHGVYVTADGEIYVTDTDHHRVAVYDREGAYVREIRLQGSDVLGEDFVYKPLKLAVADGGNLFVAADGSLEGLMEISPEGEFYGFVGSNKVSYNPLELIWRRIFTDTQRRKLLQNVPVEYKNVALDSDGFLYTVTAVSDVSTPVKRLNQSGDDVLRTKSTLSKNSVSGDLLYPTWYQLDNYGPSTLVDVTSGEDGLYYILDAKRGRVFCYDEDGNILFEFGGRNAVQYGMTAAAAALERDGSDLLVLDSSERVIQVYSRTAYADQLIAAQKLYQDGDYTESYREWMAVLSRNANFRLAYAKAGYCRYRQADYREAMELFLRGNAREGYSKAYTKYRQEVLNRNFPFYFAGLLVAAAGVTALVLRHKRREAAKTAASRYNRFLSSEHPVGRQCQFAVQTAAHPLRGFGSIREEGNGSVIAATVCLLLLFLSRLLTRQLLAFLFNSNYNSPVDLGEQFRSVLLPVVLFVAANWAITSFMDGKGKTRDIYMVVGYSVLPLVAIPLVMAICSRVMTLDESVFLTLANVVAWGWTGLLLFIGIGTVHQYGFGKTVLCFVLTAVSAVIILFICFLFFSLLQEITGFVYSVYTEIMLR